MGGAIALGLHHIRERRRYYKRNGMAAYRPWMILMTDGKPNDPWHEHAAQARQMAAADKLTFVGVGIGEHAEMETLARIVPGNAPPHRLRDVRFREFFQWLSDNLGSVSRSDPAEKTTTTSPRAWAFPI